MKNGNHPFGPLLGEFQPVDKIKNFNFHENFCVIMKEEIAAIQNSAL